MNNVILDVGANDGIDGLGYALFNLNLKVYSFEPNPNLIKKIIENKKKIENFFNLNLNNYVIIQKAVSDFNGKSNFYISDHDLCSSLLKYDFVETKKKILCEVLTLKKFCKENKINNIVYLHCDAQGSDFNVLKGLQEYKNILHSGVVETMYKKKDILYDGESTLKDFEFFFSNNGFKIYNKIFFDSQRNVINIYFKNIKIKKKDFLSKVDFNRRFIKRIIENRIGLKDIIFKNFFRFKIKFNNFYLF